MPRCRNSCQEMYLTTNSQCDVGGEWKSFVTEIPNYSISGSSDGVIKLFVKFRNAKFEETQCFMASITLDTIAPNSPTGLALEASNSIVETPVIYWTDSSDIGSGIKEYRARVFSTGGEIVPETVLLNKDQFTGLSLTYDTTYSVQVKAVDNAGNESSFTTTVVSWTPVGSTPTPGSVSCPTNYVFVPAPADQVVTGFCAAKYEMKKVGAVAVSQAGGKPWVNVDRATAQKACQDLGVGYDLISNVQWQTVARNVASVTENWRMPASGGFSFGSSQSSAVGSGSLSYGNAEGYMQSSYVLAANIDDSQSCGSGACTSSKWLTKRTHVLSNGQVKNIIWDLSGNVEEWVGDDYTVVDKNDKYVSSLTSANNLQDWFGTTLNCSSPTANNYCGYGYYWGATAGGGVNYNTIARGGRVGDFQKAGVFASFLGYSKNRVSDLLGFRCVYVPGP